MLRSATLAIAVAATLAAPAAARPYVHALGGVSWQGYDEIQEAGVDRLDFTAGATLGIGGGWRFGQSGWRSEVELTWTNSQPQSFRPHNNGRQFNIGGDVSTYALFASGAYDFGRRQGWAIQPYIEAGLGAMVGDITLGDFRADHSQFIGGKAERRLRAERVAALGQGRTSIVPAYRVGIGVTIPVTERVELIVGARYAHSITPALISGDVTEWGGRGSSAKYDFRYTQAIAGLRFGF